MQNGALLKRLGYLAEHLELSVEDYTTQWRAALTGGYALLDPEDLQMVPLIAVGAYA